MKLQLSVLVLLWKILINLWCRLGKVCQIFFAVTNMLYFYDTNNGDFKGEIDKNNGNMLQCIKLQIYFYA